MILSELVQKKIFKILSLLALLLIIIWVVLLSTDSIGSTLGLILIVGTLVLYFVGFFIYYYINQDDIKYEKESINLDKEVELAVDYVKRNWGDYLFVEEKYVERVGETTRTPISVIKGYMEEQEKKVTIINNLNSPEYRQIRKGYIDEAKLKIIINSMATEIIKENKRVIVTKKDDGTIEEITETQSGNEDKKQNK